MEHFDRALQILAASQLDHGISADAPLPADRAAALPRLRGPGDHLPEVGRPLAGQEVHHAGPDRRSKKPGSP